MAGVSAQWLKNLQSVNDRLQYIIALINIDPITCLLKAINAVDVVWYMNLTPHYWLRRLDSLTAYWSKQRPRAGQLFALFWRPLWCQLRMKQIHFSTWLGACNRTHCILLDLWLFRLCVSTPEGTLRFPRLWHKRAQAVVFKQIQTP